MADLNSKIEKLDLEISTKAQNLLDQGKLDPSSELAQRLFQKGLLKPQSPNEKEATGLFQSLGREVKEIGQSAREKSLLTLNVSEQTNDVINTVFPMVGGARVALDVYNRLAEGFQGAFAATARNVTGQPGEKNVLSGAAKGLGGQSIGLGGDDPTELTGAFGLDKEAIKKIFDLRDNIDRKVLGDKVVNTLSQLDVVDKTIGNENLIPLAAEFAVDPAVALSGILKAFNVGGKAMKAKALQKTLGKIESLEITKADDVDLLFENIAKAKALDSEVTFAKAHAIGVEKLKRAETLLIDKAAPLRHFNSQVEKILGKSIPMDDSPFDAFHLFAGHQGKIDSNIKLIGEIVDPAKKLGKDGLLDLEKFMFSQRSIERAGQGLKNPGDINGAQALQKIFRLKKKLGPEKFKVLTDVSKELNNYNNTLLKELRNNGLISNKAYIKSLQRNQQFTPFDSLDKVIKDANDTIGFQFSKSGVPVNKFGLKKTTGTADLIDNPLEAMVRRTANYTAMIERNKVVKKLTDMRKLDPRVGEFIRPLRNVDVDKSKALTAAESRLSGLSNKIEKTEKLLKNKVRVVEEFTGDKKRLHLAFENKSDVASVKKVSDLFDKEINKVNANLKLKLAKLKKSKKAGGEIFEKVNNEVNLLKEEKVRLKSLKSEARNIARTKIRVSGEELEKIDVSKLSQEDAVQIQKINKEISDLNKRGLDKTLRAKERIEDLKSKINTIKETKSNRVNADLPNGFEAVSVFENGVKMEYAIPKDIAATLKGLNAEHADFITKMASFSNKAFRAGTTSLNVPFVVTNAIRDFQTAKIASGIGFNSIDWIKGFAAAARRGKDYDEFMRSGAAFSGLFERNKTFALTLKEATRGKVSKTLRTILNPFKLINEVNSTIELAPRIGLYKRALKAGKTIDQAALIARRGTIDFAVSGELMKTANMWVPFLNARLQGTLSLKRGFQAGNRVRSALYATQMVVAPAVATYMWNTRMFPDIWDDIPEWEKENNFIVVTGREMDENGKIVPTGMKLPKGDVGKILGNPIESFLNYMDGKGADLSDIAMQFASDVSPIDFERDGKVSLSKMVSSGTPQIFKTPFELAPEAGYSSFQDRDIVPFSLQGGSPEKQYNARTTKFARAVGDRLGVSPMKVDYAIRNLFGEASLTFLDPSSLGDRVTRRFTTLHGGEKDRKAFEQVKEIQRREKDIRIDEKRETDKIALNLKKLSDEDRASALQYLKSNNKDLFKKLNRDRSKIDIDVSKADAFAGNNLSLKTGGKLQYALQQLTSIPAPQRGERFNQLVEAKVITKKVLQQMNDYFTNFNPDKDVEITGGSQ